MNKPENSQHYFDYRGNLRSHYENCIHKNKRYSLRAMARDLQVSSTALSEVINNRRHFSRKNLEVCARKLQWSSEQTKVALLQAGHAPKTRKTQYMDLAEERLALISNWYFFAVLNLSKLPEHEASPQWISARLAISEKEAQFALSTLKKLGLIEVKKQKIHRTSEPLSSSRDIPSQAIRQHHKQMIHKAVQAIDAVDVQLRDISATTMVIDRKFLPAAKDLIVAFHEKMSTLLESGDPEDVYTMAVQLFPLTSQSTKREGL